MGRVVSILGIVLGVSVGFVTLASAEDAVVTLKSGRADFAPKKVVIHVGNQVIWKNTSSEVHSVTSFATESGPQAMAGNPEINKLVKPGTDFSHRFQTAGTYFYFCPIHQGMWGTVVVEE